MRACRILAVVAALVVNASAAFAGWWDDLDKGEVVRLGDVFAQPVRYGDRTLTFFCVVLGRDEVYFPLATPFNEARWDNIAVWDDGAPIWEEETYTRRARPYLYVEKTHPQRDALLRLEKYTRVEMTARVRAVHRGIPFLEILSWRLSGWRLGERVVRAMIQGDNKVREGGAANGAAALDLYTSALQRDLAPVYALQIKKRAADVMRRLGRHDEAEVMEGTRIHGGSFAPESATVPETSTTPSAESPSAAPPFIAEDLPGQPATSRAAPSPSTSPGPSTAAPGPAPSHGAPPLVSTDLPGVEVPRASAPFLPLSPVPSSVPSPMPPPATTPSLSPPPAALAPGALPPPLVRPNTSRDLPAPPAEGDAAASGAPSATPIPPPARAPAEAPPPVPPAATAPPKRQPRLEGVK